MGDGSWPSGLKRAIDVSEQTGMSEARIRELADARLIPHWRIDGGDPLFKLSEVKEWLARTRLLTRCDGGAVPLSFVVMTEYPALTTQLPAALRAIAEWLRTVPLTNAVGIYFLCSGESIVYIGQSVSVAGRIAQHRHDGKVFDRAFVLPCLPEHLNLLEGHFIRAIRPTLNGRCAPATDPTHVAALYPEFIRLE